MTTVAIGIQQEHWQDWLLALRDLARLREIEVTATMLREYKQFVPAAERQGLRVKCVRDLLSPEVARYLDELPNNALAALTSSLIDELRIYRTWGVETVGTGCGLERLPADDKEKAFRTRVGFLKKLAAAAEEQGLALCVPLRYPQDVPDGNDLDRVVNLVHDVMHPACRLAVSVFPGELAPDFDPMSFMRQCGFRLGLLRFCYEPALGESVTNEQIVSWTQALKWHGFRGTVVFAPRISDPAAATTLSRNIEQLASHLWNAATAVDPD